MLKILLESALMELLESNKDVNQWIDNAYNNLVRYVVLKQYRKGNKAK